MLSARGLHLAYPGGPAVLDGLDLDVGRGETLAVVGPSGCGKTTLLYLLCGLAAPDSGLVGLDGAPVTGPTPDISILLQDYGLLPWKTVLANVTLGLEIQGVPRAEREERARRLLDEMGLAGRERDLPARLSGGEQQRVAIARAFVHEPKVLLLDEPFSSLDAQTRERLQLTLLTTWRARRTPFVLVTHSLEEAAFLGGRILVLGGRPARVTACLDNPGFPDPGYRDRPEFHALVTQLRRLLARGDGGGETS